MRSGKTAGNSIACSFAVTGILFKVKSLSTVKRPFLHSGKISPYIRKQRKKN